MTYPEVITDTVLAGYAHIPNEKVLEDIRDAMVEIEALKERIENREQYIVCLNKLLIARRRKKDRETSMRHSDGT